MTGTFLWLVAISFIVVGLIVFFYGVKHDGKQDPIPSKSRNDVLEDDAKELIVDCLMSSDAYQRQAMAKQLAEFEVVDEVILQLLQEIADGDKDEGVRETAVSTLKSLNS